MHARTGVAVSEVSARPVVGGAERAEWDRLQTSVGPLPIFTHRDTRTRPRTRP